MGSLAENIPLEAELTMRFLLPTLICLAVAFHSGALSSHLPLILLIRNPTNPFQILLPVWNLGGIMASNICFILWTSLSWESICCSEKNPWTRHHPDTDSYGLTLFLSPHNGRIWKLCSGIVAMLCLSFAFHYNCHHKPTQPAIPPFQRTEYWGQRS